jgi:hypothetical protein
VPEKTAATMATMNRISGSPVVDQIIINRPVKTSAVPVTRTTPVHRDLFSLQADF